MFTKRSIPFQLEIQICCNYNYNSWPSPRRLSAFVSPCLYGNIFCNLSNPWRAITKFYVNYDLQKKKNAYQPRCNSSVDSGKKIRKGAKKSDKPVYVTIAVCMLYPNMF